MILKMTLSFWRFDIQNTSKGVFLFHYKFYFEILDNFPLPNQLYFELLTQKITNKLVYSRIKYQLDRCLSVILLSVILLSYPSVMTAVI